MRARGRMRLRARRRSVVGHCARAAASVYKEDRGVSLPVKDLCQIHHGRRLPFQLRQLNGIGSRRASEVNARGDPSLTRTFTD